MGAAHGYIDESSDWLPPGPVDLNSSPNALSQSPRLRFTGMLLSLKNGCPIISRARFRSRLRAPWGIPATGSRFLSAPLTNIKCRATVPVAPLSPDADNFLHAFAYSVTRRLTRSTVPYQLPSLPFGRKKARPYRLRCRRFKRWPRSPKYGRSRIWTPMPWSIQPGWARERNLTSAKTPVHLAVRNFLYFDNHVATKKVTKPKDY